MANFGIGLGAFMNGLTGGMQAYSQIDEAKDRKRLRDMQFKEAEQTVADKQAYRDLAQQGTADATAARQADIGKRISVGAAPSPDDTMTVPTYQVGNKDFGNDRASAEADAEKQVGTFMDYYMKTTVPKMQEHWLQTGEVDKAQAIGKWMEDENVKKGTKLWAGAVRSFQVGDKEGFKTNLLAAYNQPNYFDDGLQAVSMTDILNKQGQLTGYEITFRDADGKERTEQFEGDDVANLALMALAPDQVLEYGMDQLKAARTQQAELAKEGREWQRTVNGKVLDSSLRREEKQEELAMGGGSKKIAEAHAMANLLRNAGWSEEKIQAEIPGMLGIYRQSQSPSDRLSSTMAMLAKADLNFAELPDSEKVTRAKALMDGMDAQLSDSSSTTGRQPAPGGKSASYGPGNARGMIQQGNIDLNARPRVKNADGSISTVRSISVNFDGKEFLIPTVSDDGRVLSEEQAIETFKKTGKHLGVFGSSADATAYAKQLHDAQAAQYVAPQGRKLPVWMPDNTTSYR